MEKPTVTRNPAYRICTPRLVIRCWDPKDAVFLKSSIDQSLAHLLPWMSWADEEPETVQEKIARLRTARGKFDIDQDYSYGIFDLDEKKVLGGTGLHTWYGDEIREIGYWIHKAHINQGLASEATSALVRVAFDVDQVKLVIIQCDGENIRSAAIPRKLGFESSDFVSNRDDSTHKQKDKLAWTLSNEQYRKSSISRIEIKAFDVVGNKLI